jgi:hypothetical protein
MMSVLLIAAPGEPRKRGGDHPRRQWLPQLVVSATLLGISVPSGLKI